MRTGHINISLPDYVRGRLKPEEAAKIEDHLRTCTLCQLDLTEIEKTLGSIDQSRTQDVPKTYFSSILPRVHTRIDQRKDVRWVLNPMFGKIILPLSGAIIVAALIWQFPDFYHSSENRSGLLAAVDASSSEEFAEMLQTTMPNHEINSFNDAIVSGALANDRFVNRELVREALASESTSPFNVVADMSPQQFLDGFGESDVANVLDKLGAKEDL